jgi:hypothetical protein
MSQQPETPFDAIEGALEYTNLLLEAAREAQGEVEAEIARVTDPGLARRKQALQLVNHKLVNLSSHLATSRKILNDLRTLRRFLFEERKVTRPQNLVQPKCSLPGIKPREEKRPEEKLAQ